MSRELKFRAWDVEQNKFLPSYADKGIEFYHEQGKDWHEKQVRDIVPVSWFLQDYNNPDNYIVQQYTGLNDKNNKEIYEGDIIEQNFGEKSSRGFVKFSKGSFRVIWPHQPYDDLGYMLTEYIIVVGNIFDNPEIKVDYE